MGQNMGSDMGSDETRVAWCQSPKDKKLPLISTRNVLFSCM